MGVALSGLGGASVGFLWPALALAQVAPAVTPEWAPAPTAPAPAPAVQPAPSPLDPPPAPPEPTTGPAFLRRPEQSAAEASSAEAVPPPNDFLTLASPWVDFSLTNFYLDSRVGNFLNLGMQFGVYAFEHLRLSARLVTPLEEVNDGYTNYDAFSPAFPPGAQSVRRVGSRSISLLYGGSVGLVVTNSKSFVFGPSLGFLRTDVEDYGTAVVVALPFEWTTQRNLRVGFELALGHAVGGSIRTACTTGSPAVSCGLQEQDRPGGTAVLFQFNMGWALGRL
jgi:hypothetical protein